MIARQEKCMSVAALCVFAVCVTLPAQQGKQEKPGKSQQASSKDGPIIVRPKGRRRSRSSSRAAVRRGLDWLARGQAEDGRWPSPNGIHDIATTGLTMLAMLADGSTLREGRHAQALERGAAWLRDQQGENGLIGTMAASTFMYCHAIGSWALIECYGLSKLATLKRHGQLSVNYIQEARNPFKVWRYYPRDGQNDSSMTGWMVLALTAAKDHGLAVDKDALRFAAAWYDQVSDPTTRRVGYLRCGGRSSREVGMVEKFPADKTEALTALGLAACLRMGAVPDESPMLAVAARTMLSKPPRWQADRIDYYYWFHGSHAVASLGEPFLTIWRDSLEPALLQHQSKNDEEAGSWDPIGVWCKSGGRIYSTAMAVLSLRCFSPRNRLIR
ncbi:MAG: hypothetical protein CMJ85_01370 [Planctomycetes bacterium]|nr:hypothetical protein [Planctomycetota bacterium]